MFENPGSPWNLCGIRQPHNTSTGAKDGPVSLPAGMVAMDRRRERSVARRQSVAVGAADGRDAVRAGATDGRQLVARGRRQRRYSGRLLLLLSGLGS